MYEEDKVNAAAQDVNKTIYRDPVRVMVGGRELATVCRPKAGLFMSAAGPTVPLDDLDQASRDRLLDAELFCSGSPRTVPAPAWWNADSRVL